MSKNIHNHNDMNEGLPKELGAVIEYIQKTIGPVPDEPLALVRLVHNLSHESWLNIASVHNLHDWFAFAIAKDKATIIEEFLATQQRLIFQRDHDVLTGLPNRRLFFDRLTVEVTRAKRTNADASIAMIDIDDFKRVNDTHGHLCGDEVLKELGNLLNSDTRLYDTASRVGGEEFAILLPSTSITTSKSIIDGMRERFSHHIFTCGEAQFSCTFSAGVTSIKAMGGSPTPEELFEDADQAMYTAKRTGKNKVCIKKADYLQNDKMSLVRSHEKQFLFSGIIADNNNE